LTKSPTCDTIESSKRGRKTKCVNVLTAEAPHRFAKSASICISADADTSGRMMKMKWIKPKAIYRIANGKITKIRG
jgi:hypothetical protein